MKKTLMFALGICATACAFTSCSDDEDVAPEYTNLITFEDAEIDATVGYINNKSYTADGVEFGNNFNEAWSSWSGFATSQLHDKETAGYQNQYSIYGDGGANGSKTFAVAYDAFDYGKPVIKTTDGKLIEPVYAYLQLTTYATLALRDGNDGYLGTAVQLTTEKANYFNVTIDGYVDGTKTSSMVVYLGDYRDSKSYLMTEWTKVDLKDLGKVDQIILTIGGSEDLYGAYGFNAPAYIAMDDFAFNTVSE